MKKFAAVLLAMSMIATPLSVLSVMGSSAEVAPVSPLGGGTFGGGDGSIGNPYIIEDVLDLQAMNGDLSAYYVLGNDIDASATSGWDSGQGFQPVGNSTTPFTGSLNGRYYNITNLFINRVTDDTGLFGGLGTGGQVLNVTLINFNCTGNNRIGGIVGDNNNGIVENCQVSGKITGTAGNAGGIVGRNRVNGLVMYCSSDCDISAAGSRDGGIVGQNVGGSDIINCHSYGQVNGTRGVGGISGYHANSGSTIKNCSSSGLIIGTDYYTGGCVGEQSTSSIIEDSMSSATVINYGANPGAGGFVGSSQFSNTIQRCGSTGDVSSSYPTSWNMGGFIGLTLYITIRDCYATGSVSGSDSVGGFVGSNDASNIERCFSSGSVSGTSRIGGFMGYNTSANATITSCFWDNETSGQAVGAWSASISEIVGKSTSEMMQESTFAGWDFANTWAMIGDHNYPKLRGTFTPIYDVHDLQDMNNNLDADYILMNDVDATETTGWNGGEGFMPVGNATDPYNGMFWGQGYAISNLFMSRSVTYQGLFGHISSSSAIENVNIANVSVTGWQFKAAIAGYNSGGKIYDSTCSGIIGTAGSNTGAVVGRMVGGLIDNCHSSCTVTSSNGNNIGGLVGSVYGGEIIINSIASGNVNGVDNVGGFVGAHSGDNSTIDHCFAYGTVSSTGKCIGGFVGQNYNGAGIYNSSATGNVSCTGPIVGILGTGGFVGSNYWSANGPTIIQFCYASGDVTGTVAVGGFVGGNGDTALACIFDCYSLGDAHSTGTTTGGFMGSGSEGPIMRCYSTGTPSATGGGVGGFAGYVGFATTSNYENNRWDTDTSLMMAGIGAGNPTQIFGNTTAQLLSQSTYNDSDFTNDWWMVDGQSRPFLRMEWDTEITNSHQLQLMAMDLAADYVLADDIDLSDIVEPSQMWGTSPTVGGGFYPIDSAGFMFSGSLDGNWHNVEGLYINRNATNYVGLFGRTDAGSVLSEVSLEGCIVKGLAFVGGLVGQNQAQIDDCSVEGEITGADYSVGGLVGNNFAPITECHTDGNVSGVGNLGGLVGYNEAGQIANCSSSTHVADGERCGGLVGLLEDGPVVNCYTTGNISGFQNIGGLIGYNDGVSISDSYATGDIAGDINVGGLVGNNLGTVLDCYSSGDVSGSTSTGGLAGVSGSLIANCSASGHVTGTNTPTGGLVGWNGANIEYSNSSGTVSGTFGVGGLVGFHDSGNIMHCNATSDVTGSSIRVGGLIGDFNSGLISDCFATGEVTGHERVGGLVGWARLGGTISNSNSYGHIHGSSTYVGGFVGYNEIPIEFSSSFGPVSSTSTCSGGFAGFNGAMLETCTAYGDVTGRTYSGGLVGYNGDSANAKVLNCTAYGDVTHYSTNDECIGGLIGRNNAGMVSYSEAHGNATGSGENSGSLIGHNTGAVYQSSSHGNADSGVQNYAGGFIGWNTGSIEQCFATGSATTTGSYAGGFIGQNGGVILNCYARGSASGDWFVGGFIGDNHQLVQNSYSVGNATGTGGNVGGFIGFNQTGFAITDCFWDMEKSATVPSDGGLPGTTAEMMQQGTFTNWDFATIWGIHEANTYPFLRVFGIPAEPQADLEVELEDMAESVMFGDVFTYHATLTNHGPGNAADVMVNVTLPTEVSLLNTTAGMIVDGRYITGNPGTVFNGEILHLFINVTVISNGTGVLNCTAFVTSSTLDPGFYPNNTFELTNINHAPTADNKNWQCTEDGAWYLFAPGVLWGATDLDGASDIANITVSGHEPSDYGAAITILPDGNFTYDPTVSATLQALHGGVTVYDSFNYTITDNRGGFANATIIMQVDGQEGQPTAVNDTFIVAEESGPNVLTGILSNDIIDEEGDSIIISSVYVPWQGTATITGNGTTITFEPRENFFGTFSFTYWISDGHNGTSLGSINMTVTGVNDAPFITNVGTSSRDALENELYSYVFEAIDYDNDTLTWILSTNATWLSMNPATGNLSGTPPIGSAGNHIVNITVGDGNGGEDWHEFTLTVAPAYDPFDSDGDGVPNDQDAFPNNANETTDTDGDGIGNNADLDDDGDGVDDVIDAFPSDATETTDTDGDSVGDNADAFPTDPAASVDADDDGYPDAWNTGYTAADSTTGLELDDDPLVPHEDDDAGGSNSWLYIIIILAVVGVIAILALVKMGKGKAPAAVPKKEAPEPATPEETSPEPTPTEDPSPGQP